MAIRYRDYLSRTIFLPCQLSADVFVSVPDIESLGWSCNSTALEVVADLTGRTCLSGQLADASSIRIILLKEGHEGCVPVVLAVIFHLVLQFWIEYYLLVGSRCLDIVIRSQVGVWRADIVLQTYAGDVGTRDAGGQVLGVVVREEGEHLGIGHRTLVLSGHIAWPACDVEVVGEIAHESDSRGDGLEGASAQCSSHRQCTTSTADISSKIVFSSFIQLFWFYSISRGIRWDYNLCV